MPAASPPARSAAPSPTGSRPTAAPAGRDGNGGQLAAGGLDGAQNPGCRLNRRLEEKPLGVPRAGASRAGAGRGA